ncbi:MAG: NAD(P)/FAD-dependent oxidoreductase [Nitrospirae bacterium]|nr:NAD(P)/FAD-dependent oxidoreductase [Nitrospirota bacterium]
MKAHHQILIVGGGNAGISVAAQLLRQDSKLDIAIVEPSEKHYYQPGWTLVGGGVFDINSTVRNEADYIPANVTWIKDNADKFEPESNTLITGSGGRITYDYMVVCCGAQLKWDAVKGLRESLGKNGVCSIYSFNTAPYTYECIKNFKGGKVVFTQPGGFNKCGGAPQKIMYLAADNFRKRGILDKADISFFTGKPGLLRVKAINELLLKVVERYGIKVTYQATLKEVRGEAKEAVFEVVKGDSKEQVTAQYDMLHVSPLAAAPDFIKNSPLAVKDDPFGWIDIDKVTMQHNRHKNIFSLGDVSNAGDTKTGAAVHKQAPVVVKNLLSAIERTSLTDLPAKYNGYTSCPLITGYGKLVLAEFDHDNKFLPTFPLEPAKERYSMWLLIKYLMPWFYWNRILKGKS